MLCYYQRCLPRFFLPLSALASAILYDSTLSPLVFPSDARYRGGVHVHVEASRHAQISQRVPSFVPRSFARTPGESRHRDFNIPAALDPPPPHPPLSLCILITPCFWPLLSLLLPRPFFPPDFYLLRGGCAPGAICKLLLSKTAAWSNRVSIARSFA